MDTFIDITKIKGLVELEILDSNTGRVIEKYTLHNALTSDAPLVLAKCLSGDATYAINAVSAYKAGNPLATVDVTTITYPSANSVEFYALFSTTDFNDTLDELRLVCNDAPVDFSQLTGLSILKDNTKSMAVTWKVTTT